MKIIGIGVDLVEIDRIRASLEKYQERFLERAFLPQEIAYAKSHADPAITLAARFAAKEAVVKALGQRIGESFSLKDMEVLRDDSGKPSVQLHGAAKAFAQKQGVIEIFVSLTHTHQHASAYAVAVGD